MIKDRAYKSKIIKIIKGKTWLELRRKKAAGETNMKSRMNHKKNSMKEEGLREVKGSPKASMIC